jgi:hypothetical protein
MRGSKELQTSGIGDRVISLGPGLASIPERLLLAHARGEVLFIAGAGISQSANLPDFRGLVLSVYARLDTAVHAVISGIPHSACDQWSVDLSGLTHQQAAEVKRFIRGDYDVVLGMLERRIDGKSDGKSRVRQAVARVLRDPVVKPAAIHRALMHRSAALSDSFALTPIQPWRARDNCHY